MDLSSPIKVDGLQVRAGDLVALASARDELTVRRRELASVLPDVSLADLAVWEGQGVLCLILDRLEAAGLAGALAPEVRQRMDAIKAEYDAIFAKYLAETIRVVKALEAGNVPVVVLKDTRAYQPASVRQSYDLDLLVPRSSQAECAAVLSQLGYSAKPTPLRDGLDNRETGFQRAGEGVVYYIDAHWELLDGYLPHARLIDAAELVARRERAEIAGTDFPVLDLEDFLLNACIHGYSHETRFPSRLIVWCDLSETLRRFEAEIDWDAFCERAEQFGLASEAYIALRLTRGLLSAPVPQWVLDRVRPPVLRLGIDRSLYGHLTYGHKYFDDALRLGLEQDVHGVYARLDANAQALRGFDAALADKLSAAAETSGGSVVTLGRAAAAYLPVNDAFAFGRIEALCVSNRRAGAPQEAASVAQWGPISARLEAGAAATPDGGAPIESLDAGPSVADVIAALWRRRRPAAQVRVGLWRLDPTEAACTLMRAYSAAGGIDLPTVVAIADLTAHGPIDWSRVAQAGKLAEGTAGGRTTAMAWLLSECFAVEGLAHVLGSSRCAPILEALDARTLHLETLSKFIGAGAATKLLHLLAGRSLPDRLARLVQLIRIDGVADLLRSARFVAAQALTRRHGRVPPRIYLAHGGSDIIAYVGDEGPRTPATTGADA